MIRALGLISGAAMLTACGAVATPEPTSTPSASSTSPAVVESSVPTPAPTGCTPDAHTGQCEDYDAAQWNEAAETEAIATATAAIEAFARPQLDQATWFAELTAYLTFDGANRYRNLDPSLLPVNEIHSTTGVAYHSSDGALVSVGFDTNAGTYYVRLTRLDDNPYLAYDFVPPDRLEDSPLEERQS